jgi:hypothetical protein
MHPTSTRNEFLRLRVLGLSFASIARRLGVSKPTLITWSRKAKPQISAAVAEDTQRHLKAIDDEVARQLDDLTKRHNAFQQELLSRALRHATTAQIETLAGEYRQQIEQLKAATNGSDPPPHAQSPPAASANDVASLHGSTDSAPSAPQPATAPVTPEASVGDQPSTTTTTHIQGAPLPSQSKIQNPKSKIPPPEPIRT